VQRPPPARAHRRHSKPPPPTTPSPATARSGPASWPGSWSRSTTPARPGKDNRAVALSPSLLATYQVRYDAIITAGHSQNPPAAGRRQSKAANLLARLDTQRADVLRFATDWTVPFDNNLAGNWSRPLSLVRHR